MFSLSPVTSVWTLRSAVKGGRTTTSAASSSLSFSEKTTFCTRLIASRWLRFIFQLPAIRGRRAGAVTSSPSVVECGQARQLPALEVLQGRAAAGADVPVGGLV